VIVVNRRLHQLLGKGTILAKLVGEMAMVRQQFSTRTALSSSTSWRPTITFDVVFVFVTSLSVNDDIRQSVYGFFERNLVKSPVNAKYQVPRPTYPVTTKTLKRVPLDFSVA